VRELQAASPSETVWRVGFAPDPWSWRDWAQDGSPFTGRWDSPSPGTYRSTYAASDAEGALLEVLAHFRPDPVLGRELSELIVADVDRDLHPSCDPGVVSAEWFTHRLLANAELSGKYCDVAHSDTIAGLRDAFIGQALEAGLADFDASALQNAEPRALTQAVGLWIWSLTRQDGSPLFDGIRFLSRFGANHEMWAVFERSWDAGRSAQISVIDAVPLSPHHEAVRRAMATHGLTTDAV
jgi:hypothetical protein